MRRFLDAGRLQAGGLARCVNPDADLAERRIVPDAALVEEILGAGHSGCPWPVQGEAELRQQLFQLTSALQAKWDAFDDERRGWGDPEESLRRAGRVDRLVARLRATLAGHPEWRLGALFAGADLARSPGERLVLLALIGRELGHVRADDPLCTGSGLALVACEVPGQMGASMSMLTAEGRLAGSGLIEESAGRKLPAVDDLCTVEATEYRLGETARRVLGLEKLRAPRGGSEFAARDPVVGMDALVLDERVQRALRMAIAQERSASTILRDWGLEAVMPCGHSVTLLFAGPPGVGKTACAEALASELGRPILVADYSRIQNHWVGGTEKNIAGIFREARRSRAVLFWDEADAMFCDRECAGSSWEVRDVNVLLNAARLALAARPAGPVTWADFEEALAMELRGPGEDTRGRIGF